MAKKKKVSKKPPEPEPPRRGLFQRLVAGGVTVFILIGIAYVGIRLIGGTEGFRYYIAENLSSKWDANVEIEESRLTRKLDLELRGVQINPSEEGGHEGGLIARLVRVDFNHSARFGREESPWIRSVDVEGLNIEFLPQPGGDVQPEALFRFWRDLTQFIGIREAAQQGGELRMNLGNYPYHLFEEIPRLYIEDASILDDSGREQASFVAEHLTFVYYPLPIPDRELHYVRIESRRGGSFRNKYRDCELEWLGGDAEPTIIKNQITWSGWTTSTQARDDAEPQPSGRAAAQYYLNQQTESSTPPTQQELQDQLRQAFE